MKLHTFLAELKRRRVVRVAVVYAVVSFVLVQVADLLVPALLLPAWAFRLVVFFLILGFPVALVLAWAFELTPGGVVRTEPLPDVSASHGAGRPGRAPRPTRPLLLAGAVIATGLVAGAAYLGVIRTPSPSHPSERAAAEATPFIAVLPFANRSPDPANEYFAEGVSEDILLHLARLEELRVVGPASSARFRGSDMPPPEIARALGVDALLVGGVRKEGDRVRITAQLLDGRTGEPRWAESYDRELADIFQVQSDVARNVATALRAALSSASERRLAAIPTEDVEAYNLYLMGRHLADRRSLPSLEAALDHYRDAIEADRGYALAHAGMAEAYAQLATWGRFDREEVFAAAHRSARRALELDDTLAEAWTTLGYVRFWHDWEWEEAEEAFQQAIELNPNHPTGHHWYSLLLVTLGRFDEAEAAIGRAVELDPLSRIIRTIRGRLYWLTGRNDDAVAEHLTALELDPAYAVGHMWLALAYLGLERTDDAVRHLRRGWELDPEGPVLRAGLALSHAVSGEEGRAREILEQLRDPGQGGSTVPFWSAVVLAQGGQVDAAFETLNEAVRQRDGWLTELRVNPLLDPLRADSRYDALLRRLGLGGRA